MTNQELNARAAEIMGWEKSPNGFYLEKWKPESASSRHTGYADTERGGKLWNPCEDIVQALALPFKVGALLEIETDYDLGLNHYAYVTAISRSPNSKRYVVSECGKDLPKVIARAVTHACVEAA